MQIARHPVFVEILNERKRASTVERRVRGRAFQFNFEKAGPLCYAHTPWVFSLEFIG